MAPRGRAAGSLLVRRASLVVAGALVAIVGLSAACTSDTRSSEQRRRDAGPTDERRAARAPAADTASLVTPVRGDSLIGAARGAGGVATLRAECAACHPAVHDLPLGRGPGPAAACLECHESEHEPIQAFYAGAVRGSPVAADTMFVARVACVECHTDTTFAAPVGAARWAALDVMCTSCHGDRFAGMLARWRQGMAWRTQAVAGYVGQAVADARLRGEPARLPVQAAREAMELLRTAGALHNVRGADQLFRAALDSVVTGYRRAGLAVPARPALGPGVADEACLGCHYGVEAARNTIFGETFEHASHVLRADIACSECHSDATYFVAGRTERGKEAREVNPRHGKTTVTAQSCLNCHHAPTARTSCTACHTPEEIRGEHPVATAMRVAPNVTRQRQLPFRHEQHAEVRCESCHAASPTMAPTNATCSSCHAPHHEPDASCRSCHVSAKPVHARTAHLGCAGCHEPSKVASLQPTRPVCLTCHVDQVDHQPGRECAPCHQVAWRPGARGARGR